MKLQGCRRASAGSTKSIGLMNSSTHPACRSTDSAPEAFAGPHLQGELEDSFLVHLRFPVVDLVLVFANGLSSVVTGAVIPRALHTWKKSQLLYWPAYCQRIDHGSALCLPMPAPLGSGWPAAP